MSGHFVGNHSVNTLEWGLVTVAFEVAAAARAATVVVVVVVVVVVAAAAALNNVVDDNDDNNNTPKFLAVLDDGLMEFHWWFRNLNI